MRVVVLMGGDSSEREVSLESGAAIAAGLSRLGHEVHAVDIANVAAVLHLPELAAADLVFPALHGGQGEDGHLQAVLDVLGVRYALSGASASALAMDKVASKRIMRAVGIPTPAWLQVTWGGRPGVLTAAQILDRAATEIGFPLVVKLNGAGSSVGVEIVARADLFAEALVRVAGAAGDGSVELLIERFIPGRELTATILLGRRLPLLEIRPREGFYDFKNKYTAGASEYLVPAPVHSPLYEQICDDALRIYELVGCRGVARVDFRLDEDDYRCLELNTIPGMTEQSLVPKAAAAVGISFDALVDDLCRAALASE